MASRPTRIAAAGLALLLAVAGCAAKPRARGAPTNSRSQSAPAAGAGTLSPQGRAASNYGVPAGQLAAHVPGCQQSPVNSHAATRLGLRSARRVLAHAVSAVTCTLQGRIAILVSFPTRQSESAAASAAYAMTAYFAAGRGWLALPLNSSDPVGQQSVVQDVALGLTGQVLLGANAPHATAAGQ